MLPRERHRPINPRFLVAISIISISGLLFLARNSIHSVVSPLPQSETQNGTTNGDPNFVSQLLPVKKDTTELKESIQSIADAKWNNYSLYIEEFSSGTRVDISSSVIYTAASVNKIPILAALYHLAGNGEIDLDQIITLQAQDVQDYGTGSIRYDAPGSQYSIKTLAKLMMKQSDNTAAYILTNHTIGLSRLQALIASWGMTQTDIVTNKTSNTDISSLMKRLYAGELTTKALTLELLSFMHDTEFEDRIPALLPDTATIYHKIGTEIGVIHDAGIVETPRAVYYVGIFTSEIIDEAATVSTIAELSKLIYDFFHS